ncbi:inositol monophosphatase family protein [Melissospora conviva]|uniref:inositol monophosphatase family protein n=1 Tax=Melissospora conviva TaxID=3388432 RepID=UPI003B7BA52E
MVDPLLHEVGELLRRTADEIVVPLFCRLGAHEISEKAPGEIVTVADQRAEAAITAGLRELLPGSRVVGEEAVAAQPGLLADVSADGDVWIVDPVDGTGNFAAGRRPFALMVALLQDGRPAASWIYDPLAGELAAARAGEATYLADRPLRMTPEALPPEVLRGAAMTRFLPPAMREQVEANGKRLGTVLTGQHCAGREYLDLLTGAQHFVLFWRTLPWDHAPGALLIREAGGVARRFDGTDYHPGDADHGLLVAANEQIWAEVHGALLAGGSPVS